METGIYVDVLLALNYFINMLLIHCAAKLAGRNPARRRIVAAALFGAVSSLAIFLPFMSFGVSILIKVAVSAGIVLIAFRWMSVAAFFRELFLLFACSFFFAGVMLALWIAFKPGGMLYFNGIVYFDISSVTLIAATALAYIVLSVFHRVTKKGRIRQDFYKIRVFLGSAEVSLNGLVDSGNSLCEPFSGLPVMICGLSDIEPLLPDEALVAVMQKEFAGDSRCGIPFRVIPYSDIAGSGMIPAFRPDRLELTAQNEKRYAENVYIGIVPNPVGDERYNAILNPDIVSLVCSSDKTKIL